MGGGGSSKSRSYTYNTTKISPVTNIHFKELADAFLQSAELNNETNKEIAQKETLLKAMELQQNEKVMGIELERIKQNKAYILLGVAGLAVYAYKKSKKGKK